MKPSLLVVLLCCTCQLAHSQTWNVHTLPFGDTIGIADLDVVNENIIWATGLRYGVDDSLYSFFLPSRVYVARTIDGGVTWSVDTVPMGENPFVACLAAFDANVAFIAGLNNFGNSKLLKTLDGGKTWEPSPVPFDPVISWVDYIWYLSPARVVVMGDPRDGEFEIYGTGNAGQAWVRTPGSDIADPLPGEFGYNNSGDNVGNTLWFGTNLGRVYRSENGGLDWNAFQTPATYVGNLSFADAQHGVFSIVDSFFFNTTSSIYHTSDGGETWVNITPADNEFRAGPPEYIPNTENIIMGLSRTSFLTGPFETWLSRDRGATWMQIDDEYNVGWTEFITGTTGWAGESQQLAHPTRIYEYIGSPLTGLFTDATLEAELKIYPNPATEHIQLAVSAAQPAEFNIMLHDNAGYLKESVRVEKTDQFEQTLDVSMLPAGVYHITVSDKKGAVTRVFVKG